MFVRLLTKENKLLFSVYVRNEQIEDCRFRFPFAANKQKLPFFISSIFRIYIHTVHTEKETICTILVYYINICTHIHKQKFILPFQTETENTVILT